MRSTALCLVFCMAASSAAAEYAAHQHGVAGMNIGVEGKNVHITFTPTGHDVMGFEHKPGTEDEKAAAKAAKNALEDGLKLFGVPKAAECRVEYTEVNSGLFHFDGDDDHDHAGEKEEHDDHSADAHGKDKHDDHAHDDDAHDKKDDHDHAHDDDAHGKKDHDEHAHDDDAHGKKDHDEHAHDDDAHGKKDHDDHAHDDEEAHDDVLAKYHFVCAHPEALDALNMAYFEMFPRAETVNVNAITDAGQYSVRLTREAPRLDLKRN